jgi:hypothetical protein
VFLDVSGIDAGVDFVDAIGQAVGSCELLIVVIGREWTSLVDSRGRRRLDDPHDFVRLEATAALERGIRVIPVLVEGAVMPLAEELPDGMKSLARRQAFELRDTRWTADVDELIQKPAGGETTARGRAVDLLIARTPPPAAASPLPGVSSTWRYRYTSGWPTIPRRVLVHRVLDVSGGRVRESIAPESGGAADVKTFDGSARIVTRFVDELTLEEFSPFLQAFGQIDRGWRKGNIPAPPEAAFASGWTISASAAAEETVTVPAGSFKAIRVELSGALLGAPRTAAQQVTAFNQRIWYAPQVKRVVKYERSSFDQAGTPMDRDRYELLDYQLR